MEWLDAGTDPLVRETIGMQRRNVKQRVSFCKAIDFSRMFTEKRVSGVLVSQYDTGRQSEKKQLENAAEVCTDDTAPQHYSAPTKPEIEAAHSFCKEIDFSRF